MVHFVGAFKSESFLGGTEIWSILWGALKNGPFCGGTVVHFFEGTEKFSILGVHLKVVLFVSEFNMHDRGDCQIKNAFVFSHMRNGGCTCAVIALDSTGI